MPDPTAHQPTGKQDWINAWRSGGRISVPTDDGDSLELVITRLFECTAVNGLPLDLLIEARATHRAPPKRFGVVLAMTRPVDSYDIPVLWVSPGADDSPSWLADAP